MWIVLFQNQKDMPGLEINIKIQKSLAMDLMKFLIGLKITILNTFLQFFHGFDASFKILEKHKKPNKFKIFIKELMMTFDIDQIKEGGFFIMVGKKN